MIDLRFRRAILIFMSGSLLGSLGFAPIEGHAQTCKLSVDDCHDSSGTYSVGVTLLPGITQSQCTAYATTVYNACDLPNNPAPSYTWPRRVKAESIGAGSDPDATVATAYYPASGTLPLRGRPVLGAIHFDYWDDGSLRSVPDALKQQQFKNSLKYFDSVHDWQGRLPFYATLNGQPLPMIPHSRPLLGTIDFISDTQSVVDQEILYASQKGLDYWAFSWWDRQSDDQLASLPPEGVLPLDNEVHWRNHVGHNRSLQLYLSSNFRERLNFALLIAVTRFGPFPGNVTDANFYEFISDADVTSSWFEISLEQWVELASEKTYQKVLGDRPLLLLFGTEGLDYWFQGTDKPERARQAIRRIRSRFREAGLGNPYIVGMTFTPWNHPGLDLYRTDEYGLDAVSVYAYPLGCNSAQQIDTILYDPQTNTNYSNPAYDPPDYLSATSGIPWQSNNYRVQVVDQDGKQHLPNASLGWDPRPEIIPTEYDGVACGPNSKARWAQHPGPGTPASDMATHLQEVGSWVLSHPDNTEPNAIVMYAWNEFTEGGFLVPTVGEGTARLDAIRGVMCSPWDPNLPPQPGGSCSAAPVGNVGFVGGGEAHGWAYDPDVPNRSIRVALYRGGPYPSGTVVAEITADVHDPALNPALGIPGNHRFKFKIPREIRGQNLYIHAVDPVRGSYNPVLLKDGQQAFVHATECQDGVDNDGDGAIDFGGDGGCSSSSDLSEWPTCSDGLDNDGDGKADWGGVDLNGNGIRTEIEFPEDPDCGKWGPDFETASGDCTDGLDNDGDSLADQGVALNGDADFYDRDYEADPQCSSAGDQTEGTGGCGLGFELALILPLIAWRARRVRRWGAAR